MGTPPLTIFQIEQMKIQTTFAYLKIIIIINIELKIDYPSAMNVLEIILILQIIKEYAFQIMKIIHVHQLTQFIIKPQGNVFIVTLNVLKMENALQKI